MLGFGILSFFLSFALPIWLLVLYLRQDRDLRAMRARVADLEARIARFSMPEAVRPPADVERLPEPIPIHERAEAAGAIAHATPAAPAPAEGAASLAAPSSRTASPPSAAAPSRPRGGVEQLVGGVWLQHAGSVLILFGAFFLILWGYTTGRFGPGLLVAAGVAVGLVTTWRGERVARDLPGFGQALIGVGLGVVYLSLYLGHFVLRSLPAWAAFVSLTLVSLATVAIGLRHRAQAIAALGLIGAFVPVLLPRLVPQRGFSMAPHEVLGYAALVDTVVFALAARAGWSALSLGALGHTAATWIAAVEISAWGWPIQLGLTALFAGLGLAPLPRFARDPERVGLASLAVIAAAPLCLIASSMPFLARVAPSTAAAYLVALAALYLVAALWVDARRPERDLWRPLTAASTVFLTAALERMLGPEHTPMAWCVEGAVLVELGLGERRGWLRFLGQVVLLVGGLWTFVDIGSQDWTRTVPPVARPEAWPTLVALGAIGVAAARMASRRDRLTPLERGAPEAWGAAANVMLMVWLAREANFAARTIEHARLPVPEAAGGTPLHRRIDTLAAVLTSAAWTAQALALLVAGWARGSAFLRWLAMGLLGLVVLKLLLFDLAQVEVFWRFLLAIGLGVALLGVSYLYQRRDRRA